MVEVSDHRHCQICGKVIPPDQTFCSKACREKFENIIRKRRRLLLILYLALIGVFALIIYVNYV